MKEREKESEKTKKMEFNNHKDNKKRNEKSNQKQKGNGKNGGQQKQQNRVFEDHMPWDEINEGLRNFSLFKGRLKGYLFTNEFVNVQILIIAFVIP